MYSLIRKGLFCLPTELSHELSLDWLGAAYRMGVLSLLAEVPKKEVEVMGLRFPNPVGLAAGLDKNADYFNALGALGFGFVEVGTVTPKPQPGNPSPRLFRLPEYGAIINRMGFNNLGVDHLVEQVKKRKYDGILGINIGKNKTTPEENALDDYLLCMDKVYEHADYITINISSPNTPGLRNLQFGDALNHLLEGIKNRQKVLQDAQGKYVPVAVKIAPDITDEETDELAKAFCQQGIDCVIATNTTIDKSKVANSEYSEEAGGLSGAPLTERATQVVANMKSALAGAMPIIGVGGIMSGGDARNKMDAGADLVQIYSGFIYKGPSLVKEAVEAIKMGTFEQ